MKQYRLVGGTALSPIYGHRKSIDLDFFTDKPHNFEILLSVLTTNFGQINPINEKFKAIFQCEIQSVKVDFVYVQDPFANQVQIIDNIPFADIKDLIALKLNAVKGRGVKKRFLGFG